MTSPAQFKNPYICAGPIREPEHFYGRNLELQRILELIGNKGSVNIVGERCSGKTSLLRQILHPEVRQRHGMQEDGNLYLYLACETIQPAEPAMFVRILLEQAAAADPDLYVPAGPANEGRILALLQNLAPRRLILLLDNFDKITRCETFPSTFFSVCRGVTHSHDVSFITTTCLPLFKCVHKEALQSPLFNLFFSLTLGAFTPAECEDFLQRSTAPSGAPLARVRDELFRLAGHLPYLLQAACYQAFEIWRVQGSLTAEDMALVEQRFSEQTRPYFEMLWERYWSDREREVLRQLSAGEQPSDQATLADLTDRGHVANGRIASAALAAFVRAKSAPPRPAVPAQGVHVDLATRKAYVDGQEINPPLTENEFALLALLCQHRGMVCDKKMIAQAIWNEEYDPALHDESIAATASRLRKKVEPKGEPWQHILSVRGIGFRLED